MQSQLDASIRNALNFNENEYVNFGDIDAMEGVQNLTIEFWLRADLLDANDKIFMKGTDDVNSIHFGVDPLDNTVYTVNVAGMHQTEPELIETGTWQHLAIVFDGTQANATDRLKVYFDGF